MEIIYEIMKWNIAKIKNHNYEVLNVQVYLTVLALTCENLKFSWLKANLGKKIVTPWNVLKSEVYLTCNNFWKFYDDLKACVELLGSQIDPKMWMDCQNAIF